MPEKSQARRSLPRKYDADHMPAELEIIKFRSSPAVEHTRCTAEKR